MPWNLSSAFDAKRPEVSVWSSASTLTPNTPVERINGHVEEVRETQKPTRGGSSDTEKKLPMARPTGRPSTWEEMTVTPVGK